MKPKVIFATTLNPKVRKLIRFTVEDIKETLEVFDLLHAKSEKKRKERQELLRNSEISYLDLDN